MTDIDACVPFFTDAHLRQLARSRSFSRGKVYFEDGSVSDLALHRGRLRAKVEGTDSYTVDFSIVDGDLDYACSCPVGRDGEFCKHCVAAAMAWRSNRQPPTRGTARFAAEKTLTLDDLRPWLERKTAETLAEFLFDAADDDERLREKLLRRASLEAGSQVHYSTLHQSIQRATRSGDFISYREAAGFAFSVREAIEPLAELLEADAGRHGAPVLDLVEFALIRVEEALESADDSDGEISEVLENLQTLHLRACEAVRPDPEELAERLFAWEMRTSWDTFFGAVDTYAELLGETGRRRYQELARERWESIPPLGPGEKEVQSSQRFRITSIMEALARKTGDLDELVAIRSKKLTHPYDFLQIATLYQDSGQPDQALKWAERGYEAFRGQSDHRLDEFLAERYHERNRPDDAMAVVWNRFQSQPTLATYQNLLAHAGRAGNRSAWRSRALEELTAAAARTSPRRRQDYTRWAPDGPRETLIRIHLSEDNVDAAWSASGGQSPASASLRLILARARAANHPGDAIPWFVETVESQIELKNNSAYDEAVGLLREVRELFLRTENPDGWHALIGRLRRQHKPKRNFIARAADL